VCCRQETCTTVDDVDQSTCRIIANVFATITAVPNAEASEAELIAMETLFDAHHPAIGTDLALVSVIKCDVGLEEGEY